MPIQTLKGFRDFLPGEARKRQYVINKLKAVFESFGFEPLETPALEYEEVLLGKYGEEGDKLMYRFVDNGGRKVALRYDQTVPLARVVTQYQNQLPVPFKRYQIQPVWRAENPQKGRFREFLQCDIDTVGSNSPMADAETIQVIIRSLESLGFTKFKVLVNDRNNFAGIEPSAIAAIDKLKKIGKEAVLEELKKKGLSISLLDEVLNKNLTDKLKEIIKIINDSRVVFDATLARGLNYYTGMIFEIEVEGYEAGSVSGGGRYDKLIGMFSGRQIPAVGFAFGFDRLAEAMDQQGLFPKDLTTSKVLVSIFSTDLMDKSSEIASQLRSNNINTELWLEPGTRLEKQLKYADLKGIPYAAIIGPEEAAKNLITLKSLKSQIQETLSLDEAVSRLI